MTMEQARKMVKGTLKGNSAMARAIKELISGEAAPEVSSPTDGERGAKTVAALRARDEAW